MEQPSSYADYLALFRTALDGMQQCADRPDNESVSFDLLDATLPALTCAGLLHNYRWRERSVMRDYAARKNNGRGVHGADATIERAEFKSGTISGRTINAAARIGSFDKLHGRAARTATAIRIERTELAAAVDAFGAERVDTGGFVHGGMTFNTPARIRHLKAFLACPAEQTPFLEWSDFDLTSGNDVHDVEFSLFHKKGGVKALLTVSTTKDGVMACLGDMFVERLAKYRHDMKKDNRSGKSANARDDAIISLSDLMTMGDRATLTRLDMAQIRRLGLTIGDDVLAWAKKHATSEIAQRLAEIEAVPERAGDSPKPKRGLR